MEGTFCYMHDERDATSCQNARTSNSSFCSEACKRKYWGKAYDKKFKRGSYNLDMVRQKLLEMAKTAPKEAEHPVEELTKEELNELFN
jgi:hypothetical protein